MGSTKIIPLKQAQPGDKFRITRLDIKGTMRRRLLDLGFIPGAIIEVLQESPLGDPVAYSVNHTTIALREEESSRIFGELIRGDTHA